MSIISLFHLVLLHITSLMKFIVLQIGTKHADILKQTLMPIVDTKKCNTSQDLEGEITPFMFCAGFKEGKHDACQVRMVLSDNI